MQSKQHRYEDVSAQGEDPLSRFAYAACATPAGTSGIAVIRMAGESAFTIADELFRFESPSYASIYDMPAYSCAYGRIIDLDHDETVDFVVLTKFTAPQSYTGEDTVEISCHGGQNVKAQILGLLFKAGARPALPGEFTRTAFLNGKIDLAQAEAVMDLISSDSRVAGMQAVRQLEGKLSHKIREQSDLVYQLLSSVEMILEFPEHEESENATDSIHREIEKLSVGFQQLIDSYGQGRILREGFIVTIAGKPNAGKSSLLNALIGYERAIVTDVPGTTRDTVEEMSDIEGIPVRLIDTAGLRASKDHVEQIGVDRAKQAIAMADLVFWITAESNPDVDILLGNDEDFRDLLYSDIKNSPILIIGKSDLYPFEHSRKQLLQLLPTAQVLPFSSVTGEGIREIRRLIRSKYDEFGSASGEEVIITNARHFRALTLADKSLHMAKDAIESNMPLDIIASTLRSVADYLAEITGDEVNEQLVNEIFSRFCIGK